MNAILTDLGLGSATYYRWSRRAQEDRLADAVRVPRRTAVPPTPVEVAVTTDYARQHPLLGYKRLAYALMAENQAFSLALPARASVRPWMVYEVLAEAQLLGRRAPEPELLVRPPEAAPPDQRGHTDLMVWGCEGRW